MQRVIQFLSRLLKPRSFLWKFTRFFYLIATGSVFVVAYHRLRLKRNSLGLHKYGAECLKLVTGFCEELGVRPILNCGSLLGYAQAGHFLKVSKDIDLAVLSEELPDPSQLIKKMKSGGFNLRIDGKLKGPLEKFGRYSLLQFHHPLKFVSVDINFIHLYKGQRVFLEGRREDYLYRQYLGEKKVLLEPYLGYFRGFSPDVYARLKQDLFEGCPVWVPENPWPLLEAIYGPEISSGKKNIFFHARIIRQRPLDGSFEIVRPSDDTIS